MAFDATRLWNMNANPPGRALYIYHTLDDYPTVDTAGYFNNKDDNLNMQKGDLVIAVHWATAIFGAGTISQLTFNIVTNVIGNDAAANAGDINIAQAIFQSGVVSSND